MRVGEGGKEGSAYMSKQKELPSVKAILLNKATQHQVRRTRPDRWDAHFVIADDTYYHLNSRLNYLQRLTLFRYLWHGGYGGYSSFRNMRTLVIYTAWL